MNENLNTPVTPATGTSDRRTFLKTMGLGAAALGFAGTTQAQSAAPANIEGFAEEQDQDASKGWKPFSDRKLRVGLVGYGTCHFSALFGFQDHPNVEVVAVSDLFPDRCAALSKHARCGKTYPSLEDMVKDDTIEAIFVATDAPSHPRHAKLVLEHGKHVCHSVPVGLGSLEDAEMLFQAVKNAGGLKYMMFETSAYHEDNYAMREIYRAGGLGEIVYSEGEYIHYMPVPLASYRAWRVGCPPMWYPTHATAYHIAVTGGSFTEVACEGFKSENPFDMPENNSFGNPFGTEVGLFRTSTGGTARIMVAKDTPGFGAEAGRVRGTRGTFFGKYQGLEKNLPDTRRPPLPPGVAPGGHGGSHGHLMDEFVQSVILDRKPLVDIVMALNLTVPGIVAHQSALKGGETLKIPQFHL